MHLCETWPSTICAHNTPNVNCTLGQVQAKVYAQIDSTPSGVLPNVGFTLTW